MFNFFLATLATYRVAHMITAEDGPFELFLRWRSWLYEWLGHDHWLTVGFGCVLCVSFWLSWLAALWVRDVSYPLAALSIAGAVLVVHRMAYR
jgi:hypothetical protein